MNRADFPLLERRLDGRPLLYLDSAATALKPAAVLQAERLYATEFSANAHRGQHALASEATEAYEGARRTIARFLGAAPRCIVLVKGTTEALNLVAHGLRLAPEDVVLASTADHHSNLVPWMARARVVMLEQTALAPVRVEAVIDALERERPRVLAIGYASNVTGVVHPVAELCRAARERGVLTVVDAAQAVPHLPVDVEQLGCDFLAFSGHKLGSSPGVGVLYGRQPLLESLQPLQLGGGTVERVTRTGFKLKEVPYRLEAGTPNVPGAMGLAAAIDYLESIGWEALEAHERKLCEALAAGLEELPGARVLMASSAPRLAIASIAPTSDMLRPDVLASILSQSYQIMVRSGFHCAHPLFDELGIAQGALRASAYLYNEVEEIQRFCSALRELLGRMLPR